MGGARNRFFKSAHFLLSAYLLVAQTYKRMRLITRVYGIIKGLTTTNTENSPVIGSSAGSTARNCWLPALNRNSILNTQPAAPIADIQSVSSPCYSNCNIEAAAWNAIACHFLACQ